MSTWKSLIPCLSLFCAAASVPAAPVCHLEKLAELPVTLAGGRPLVSGAINGTEAHFLADSGSYYNFLTRDAAQKFSLKLRSLPRNLRIRGVGGEADARLTEVATLSLAGFGGRAIHDAEFVVSGNGLAYGIDGIIGQNMLGLADTEYDLANGMIRLFSSHGCGRAPLAYWQSVTDPATILLESGDPQAGRLLGHAKLDGHVIRVVLDSGAARSLLTTRAAALAGVTLGDAKVRSAGFAHGLGPREIETWTARFSSLDIGGEQIRNPVLRISKMELGDDADMLLGADFFLSHRVYVAHSQHRIFLTYNGGRVFNLDDVPAEPNAEAATTQSGVQNGAVTPDPDTSAGLRRQGAAAAARHDFRNAIALLDRAIAMEPGNGDNHLLRGDALRHEGHLEAALADFDRALILQPDSIPALMARAAVRLASKNPAGATEDFDRAERLAPGDAALGLKVVDTYLAAEEFGAAISRLEGWIDRHPDDARVATALQDRCWARAMQGRDLDLALADCDAAMKKGAHSSRTYAGRGFVHLRRGELDAAIDDYQRSLELQPKAAWTLFGLGLAQSRKGLTVEGSRNMETASAADPDIALRFQKRGLVP